MDLLQQVAHLGPQDAETVLVHRHPADPADPADPTDPEQNCLFLWPVSRLSAACQQAGYGGASFPYSQSASLPDPELRKNTQSPTR